MISPNHSAFIGRRQCIDVVFVANECLNAALKNGDSRILCKLDLEKAYDKVNWVILDYMLKMMVLAINGIGG